MSGYLERSLLDAPESCPACGEPCRFERISLDAMSAYYAGKSVADLSTCCDAEKKISLWEAGLEP